MTSPDPAYIHGHSDSVLRSHRWRTAANSAAYLLPHLRAGQRLLDVGCGPGTLTVDLARHAGEGGEVVGVDLAESVVAEATTHAAAEGMANVRFLAGDFRDLDLDLEPGSFDVVHAHQVLQHLPDPPAALAAMAALAKPDGVVAARDADYLAFFWTPENPRLERWRDVYLEVSDRNGTEGRAGRNMLRWARQAGLADIAYSTSTWTYATVGEREWWGGLWADRIRSSTLANQAVEYGVATREDLEDLAA
ncbi:MAG TPA: class I SAM-dependent methyltransferase, partial [Acidimicrobiia bacterium]|nr:class I SAM-dependent methyltransferase [Acidimicrobiia bacterium]